MLGSLDNLVMIAELNKKSTEVYDHGYILFILSCWKQYYKNL